MGFPDSSVHKESTCNAGDPGSIPGSGRFAGEGIGYPLQQVMPLQWQLSTLGYPFLGFPMAQLLRICLQCGRPGFSPLVGKIPWRRERISTSVLWHLENSIENIQRIIQRIYRILYSPWDRKSFVYLLITFVVTQSLNFSVYLFIFFSWFLVICSYHSTCKFDSNTTYSE